MKHVLHALQFSPIQCNPDDANIHRNSVSRKMQKYVPSLFIIQDVTESFRSHKLKFACNEI